MKAVEAKMLDFLQASPQFIIPIYQRTYSWLERECQQLWDDILRTGKKKEISAHFVGSVVYIEESLYSVTIKPPVLVIDGQQRLATVSLLLEALARELGDEEPVDGFSAEKIRTYYLLNKLEKDDRRFKLLLTQTDKESLLAIVQQRDLPTDHSIRIAESFDFFRKKISKLNGDLTALCHGLAKLMIVDISLSREQDNPQLIFESMNSTGRELTQADLVRNFILMGLESDHQKDLYTHDWRPMEVEFGQEAYGKHFDSFMRHYLTVRTDEIPRISEVYEAFKKHARSPEIAEQGVDGLVEDIHTVAHDYCAMALGKEEDPALSEAFADLRELGMDVVYPFLLELYEDYRGGALARDELLEALRLVEAYVFRRGVCSIPTNSLNKTFATFSRSLKKDRYLESIKAHFLLLPSYRRFPADAEFERGIQTRDLYHFRSRSYWLRRLENFGRKERVVLDEYTIEHILPQNENLSDEWRQALGVDWQRVQEDWLHTLGNLTLTRYNSEYSDHSFPKKRDMEGGFRKSPVRLNEGLGELEAWNESTIRDRAGRLAKKALTVWPAPQLAADVLQAYRPAATKSPTYSVDDHPHLVAGPMRELFEAFRKQVLALDPCVAEEFLKLYVAYKAETNFVDVIPQKSRLLLSINLTFHELHDPRDLARDVAGLSRWGNGDVEVGLTETSELPYVIALIRQAFEKQMGNGGHSE